MKTRRSPRNQMILWRALNEAVVPSPKLLLSVEAIERMLTQPFLNKTSRSMLKRDLQQAKMKRALNKT